MDARKAPRYSALGVVTSERLRPSSSIAQSRPETRAHFVKPAIRIAIPALSSAIGELDPRVPLAVSHGYVLPTLDVVVGEDHAEINAPNLLVLRIEHVEPCVIDRVDAAVEDNATHAFSSFIRGRRDPAVHLRGLGGVCVAHLATRDGDCDYQGSASPHRGSPLGGISPIHGPTSYVRLRRGCRQVPSLRARSRAACR
jgi:hypothetical protein